MVGPDNHIRGVLFDFDGTLTQPGALDFDHIKSALGCPLHLPVLEFILDMADVEEQKIALARLEQFEVQGARNSRPNIDAQEVVAWVKSNQMPTGIITRNSRASVVRALQNFDRLEEDDFDLIITRDDPHAIKPSGAGVVWAAQQWQIGAGQMLVVGDYIFDPQAGRDAGALTVLLDPHGSPRLADVDCDYRISGLAGLPSIISAGLTQPAPYPNDTND